MSLKIIGQWVSWFHLTNDWSSRGRFLEQRIEQFDSMRRRVRRSKRIIVTNAHYSNLPRSIYLSFTSRREWRGERRMWAAWRCRRLEISRHALFTVLYWNCTGHRCPSKKMEMHFIYRPFDNPSNMRRACFNLYKYAHTHTHYSRQFSRHAVFRISLPRERSVNFSSTWIFLNDSSLSFIFCKVFCRCEQRDDTSDSRKIVDDSLIFVSRMEVLG